MRIEFSRGQYGVYQPGNNGREVLVATFGTLAAAQEAFPDARLEASAITADPTPASSVSEPAGMGVMIGGVTVVALPILEVIGAVSLLSTCSGAGAWDLVLIAIPIASAAGGTTALVLGSKSTSGPHERALARRLGIGAIVVAAVSLPINAFLVALSGFCALG